VAFGDIDAERGPGTGRPAPGAGAVRATDVAKTEQVTQPHRHRVERFGGLHIMVNNAGVSGTMHRSFLDDDSATSSG